MNPKIFMAPIVIIAASVAYSAYQNHRLTKLMRPIEPLPPVGAEYLRMHSAMLQRPDVVAANETINDFLAHQQ